MGIDKKFEVYIDRLCKRIRNKDVHDNIKLEIGDHLQELKEDAMRRGLSEEEAVNEAMMHIGDEKILGKQLNKTHKAPLDLQTILPVLAVSLLGLLVMYYQQFHSTITALHEMKVFNKSLVFYLAGLLLMLIVFRFDYRKLAKHSIYIYGGTLFVLSLTLLLGVRVDGIPFINIGFAFINFTEITPYLLAVSFAGIFHAWNWKDIRNFWIGAGLLAVPILLLSTTGAVAATFISLMVSITIMSVSSASLKQVLSFTAPLSILPMGRLFVQADTSTLPNPYSGLTLGDADFIGSALQSTPGLMSEVHTDFIFSYTIYTFGWLFAIIVFALIAYFIWRIISTGRSMVYSYGRLLTIGLATTFSVQFILSTLMNLGLSALPGAAMPFMSFGGSHILLEMIAVGLLLSIYRRRNTVEQPMAYS
ncbi:FtsW/RodA/SpoVE family cell cycle protein [Bacillus hwajinpoensis]|uniref:FtsW/RodA/SpoVE family cell cycle protein n=1 Tax=Guptibacillus hwajinpoensis TaxID=208199 RepID=A0A845EYA9_9BACL|nr:FtsW/RodA/SpoVE family cell cycle protein [Pseudalkalibacillus hwajinpoensis]MYL63496.1 FtsW/RodA/SpoVE family cell cycle protein [Pseudalkalibacillus hwajinpoensis]